MNAQEFSQFLDNLIDAEKKIMIDKGNDYTKANEGAEEDRLYNFKDVAARTGLTPIQVWGIYFTKQINAIEKYIRTGKVASEPIEERFKDARNYLALGLALIQEEKFPLLTTTNVVIEAQPYSFQSQFGRLENSEIGGVYLQDETKTPQKEVVARVKDWLQGFIRAEEPNDTKV